MPSESRLYKESVMSNTDSQKFRDALELFELCIYFIPGLKKIFFYFFVDRLTY